MSDHDFDLEFKVDDPVFVDKPRREIWLSGEVDEFSTREIVKGIDSLASSSRDLPIDLIINSPGGSLFDGLSLCDYMKWQQSRGLVLGIRVMGMAYSAAAIISSSGSRGRRTTFASSRFLIHQLSADVTGKMEEIAKVAANCQAGNDCMAKHLSDNTGKDLAEINARLKTETYFSAAEAVAFGLVDSIL